MPEKNAPKTKPASRRSPLALRFISGKYQGGEFVLEEGHPVIIGRASNLDMVLIEEMVSRRHARVEVEKGVITIEDLGSTNGTFVNGEKIKKANLREGDRVLIGTSILKLVPLRDLSGAHSSLAEVAAERAKGDEAPRMSGNLAEIPLPDLLQLFATSRKNGVLVVRTDADVGRIYLRAGVIHQVVIEDRPEIPPLKSAYRMLGWERGLFELEPADPRQFEKPLDLSAQEILMEGFRQKDELNALQSKLPPFASKLTLCSPLRAPLHELEPTHLDVLQIALNSPSLEVLLDRTQQTDLETAQVVKSLIDRGYLQAAPG
ncbi:MAG TPA: DUF4388 domain-containing protein [Polyangiaceae bacterium]|jgi:pSer/pThr/pTyr-binding forkhead associated (FHA) protein